METIKPETLSLVDIQRIVADKIMAFDTIKKSLESAAPAQQNVGTTTADYGKSSSKPAQINSITQQSAGQEYKPFTGTIRKDRERQRSRSIERVDYSKKLGLIDRRKSTGSAWNLNKRYEEEFPTRGQSAERGRSRGRSADRYRNRGESIANASNADAISVYSISSGNPESVRSRSRSRERPLQPMHHDRHHDRQRRDRRFEHPSKMEQYSAC
jgi:hypothetical protein